MQRASVIASHLKNEAGTQACAYTKDWDYRSTGRPGQTVGKIGVKAEDDVVIIAAQRTAMAKGFKGSFKDTRAEDLLVPCLAAVCEKSGTPKVQVEDIAVGNVTGNGFSGCGPARALAGFPETTSTQSLNRQCSSGLSAILAITGEIRAGVIDCGIGAGVERMTGGGMGGGGKKAAKKGDAPKGPKSLVAGLNQDILKNSDARDMLIPMGITSENVSERYGITRAEQDALALSSYQKALAAQARGDFNEEIVPVTTMLQDPKTGELKKVTVVKDEGPRPTTAEGLAKLKPAFKKGGLTTAGSSSQVTDGAAAVLLMRRSKATELGVKPIGAVRATSIVGVPPDVMGIGPAYAIPEVLKKAGLQVNDVDVYEVNEAFASQAEFTVRKVGIPRERLNPVGGAIALGHPLGCTGARQVCTLMPQMRRQKAKLGITSMCLGTGMGMACLIENEAL